MGPQHRHQQCRRCRPLRHRPRRRHQSPSGQKAPGVHPQVRQKVGAEDLIDKFKSMQIQLQSLLNQISVIVDKEKSLRRRQYDSGETFNVFDVLRLQRDEVRLHSSFIAALLDPKGPHGLKTKLLESFLQVMQADDATKWANEFWPNGIT